MRVGAVPFLMIAVLAFASITLDHPLTDGVDAQQVERPVRMSGEYLEELENGTVYRDHLQPDQSGTYLIHIRNDGIQQSRYRITVSNIPSGWQVFLDNLAQTETVTVEKESQKARGLNLRNLYETTGEITVTVDELDTDNSWDMVLKIICEEGPVDLDLTTPSYQVGKDVPAEVTVTVNNIGAELLNVTMDMEGIVVADGRIIESWCAVFETRNFRIPPGASKEVPILIYAPSGSQVNDQKVTRIMAEAAGMARPFFSSSINLKVTTIYDLRTTVIPPGYQRVSPGGVVEFSVKLENWAGATDFVNLRHDQYNHFGISFNDSIDDPLTYGISIPPESSVTLHPVISVDIVAQAGRHRFILEAEGQGNKTEIILRLEVARKDSFETSHMAGGGGIYGMNLGSNLMDFKLHNTGNFYDTVHLEIMNSPSWAQVGIKYVTVGSPEQVMEVNGTGLINISGAQNVRYEVAGSGTGSLRVAFSPFQPAVVTLQCDIPMDADPAKGVVGIRYSYGIFQMQEFLQLSMKLILVNLDIEDLDGDGIPDLEVSPAGDIKVGDTLEFRFVLRNDYPFATRDVLWRIELQGQVLIKGDVGEIPPGENKTFEVEWKADKRTETRHPAYLQIYGEAYESEEQAPTAKTDEAIYIASGDTQPNWGLMVLFAGAMLLVLAVFTALWITSRRIQRKREEEEQAKYEALYGSDRPSLGSPKKDRLGPLKKDRLDEASLPELPSAGGKKGPERTKKSARKRKKEKGSDKGKRSGKKEEEDLEDEMNASSKKKRSKKKKKKGRGKKESVRKDKETSEAPKRAPDLDDLEEMEELEEI